MPKKNDWLRLLGYVTGLVNQELLLRNAYLVAENRILKAGIKGRLRLSEGEKATLAEIAKRLGRKALADIAGVAKPDTLLAWYRKLVAQKFNGSKRRGSLGRPRRNGQSGLCDLRSIGGQHSAPSRNSPARKRSIASPRLHTMSAPPIRPPAQRRRILE